MLCKKTNGFELISPGKFDFSTRRPAAGAALRRRRRAACPRLLHQQQCHGVVSGRRQQRCWPFWLASRAETGSARLLWAERAWNWINNFWSLRTSYGPLCTRIWGEYASARLLDILMCGSPLGHVDAATGRHSHRSDCSSAAALDQGASGDGRWHRWRMLVLWCTVVLITKLGGAKSLSSDSFKELRY